MAETDVSVDDCPYDGHRIYPLAVGGGGGYCVKLFLVFLRVLRVHHCLRKHNNLCIIIKKTVKRIEVTTN